LDGESVLAQGHGVVGEATRGAVRSVTHFDREAALAATKARRGGDLGGHEQAQVQLDLRANSSLRLKRSPDTATAADVRLFQLHLIESGASICNRNRIMTGVRFLFRITLRRHDLAAEIYPIKESLKLPLVPSPGRWHRASRRVRC
jgi:hypothetical protein